MINSIEQIIQARKTYKALSDRIKTDLVEAVLWARGMLGPEYTLKLNGDEDGMFWCKIEHNGITYFGDYYNEAPEAIASVVCDVLHGVKK